MAMGSAAFLVQACRYLSERLVEAWDEDEERGEDAFAVAGLPDFVVEHGLPRDAGERLALARRLVADNCLYGVDKNPLAVEMGKLSLWLTTLQKGVPFTFLDHALRNGDSLLGITSLDQLKSWSLDLKGARNVPWFVGAVERALATALDLRRRLHSFPVLSVRDAEDKARLLAEAEEAMELVRLGADLLVAASLQPARRREDMRVALLSEFHAQVEAQEDLRSGTVTGDRIRKIYRDFSALRARADELLGGRRPFHWPLEFPEVFAKAGVAVREAGLAIDDGDLHAGLAKSQETSAPGFAAVVGNPPFQGGQKITGSLGTDYRDYLVEYIASGKRGKRRPKRVLLPAGP
ncbi:MAG: hypothetical protein M3R38_24470 [Actinomycetota bacterium]|nr:hypothetical protein [Actinomycetota bacterium]